MDRKRAFYFSLSKRHWI